MAEKIALKHRDGMTTALTRCCTQCGRSAESTVSQALDGHRLVWSESFCCPDCNCATESDGIGTPDACIREAILRHEGLFGWYVTGSSKSILSALSLVRNVLGLTVPEVAEVRRYLPGLFAVGTKTEMKWLATLSESSGIESSIRPAEAAVKAPVDLAHYCS